MRSWQRLVDWLDSTVVDQGFCWCASRGVCGVGCWFRRLLRQPAHLGDAALVVMTGAWLSSSDVDSNPPTYAYMGI
jgi:hypothetical protein